MPWRDAYLTLSGIRQQNEEGMRALGQIMVDLWSSKPTKINQSWFLPFDNHTAEANVFEHLKNRYKQRQIELNQLKDNGSN